MIQIKHLRKEYANAVPLKDVNVTINKGDVISIIGPSGTGKSTFIRMINKLEEPTSGEILLDGENILDPKCDLSQVRKKIGMVFQNFNLFPHLTVIENCMIGPIKLLNISKQEAYDKAIRLLESVGLAQKALNYPDDLSGGQKQRVAIARTLSMEPKIILFDEPTSALDPTNVKEVQTVIRELAEKGHTMMIVTHEMKFAKEISNRVFYMDDGGIYEDGSPNQIFENPQKELTQIFINKLKLFEEKITTKSFDFIGFNTKIEEFGRKYQMDQKNIYRLQTVFEEFFLQLLFPSLTSEFKANVTIKYPIEKDNAVMQIDYSGFIGNPMLSDNILSFKMIEASIINYEYKLLENDEYQNCIKFII